MCTVLCLSFSDHFRLTGQRQARSTLFPYTTLFRSQTAGHDRRGVDPADRAGRGDLLAEPAQEVGVRSEEHTSELQSHSDLVCRLLLEKKNACLNFKLIGTVTISTLSFV